MMIETLTPVAAGAPLLAAVALLRPRPSSLVASRLALGGAAAAGVAALVLLLAVPEGGASALGGLLLVDRVRLVIALLAATIAVLVVAFAQRALAGDGAEVRFARLASLLTGATITLALAGSVVVLALAWVLVGQALIALLALGRSPASQQSVRRTRRTFLVGDAALVLAVGLLVLTVGPVALGPDLTPVAAELAAGSVVGVAGLRLLDVVAVLVVVAAMARSALLPLHRWLPSTLAAPTPVSALLHAGVVNGAGVLLLALAPVFGAAPAATALAFVAGATTAVLALAVMLVRTDVKGGLAWSTAAQMGFMVVQLAIGAYGAALFHLVGHGLYKAAAFLGAGEAVGVHARRRHRPVSPAALGPRVRVLATIGLPTAGLALAWWVISPGFSAAKTLLFVTVAWLLTAYLVRGWVRTAPIGVAPSLAVAAIGAPVVAVAYLGALVGFERAVGSALPPVGTAAIGVIPLALVLVTVAAATALLVGLPAAAGLRRRAYAALVGFGIRPDAVGDPQRHAPVTLLPRRTATAATPAPAALALTSEVTR